ncbi:hypothetical protein GCM10018962_92070 [Dactylosporangium matsuzakiense]|uniref:Uncharacterized protein n=1 Tax=Dactylosporangium matsuzakiense TaxID=53360 RepID=A0A9W6NS18_9ACTN|nr:hypothetical protein GCM10017581_089210 [Dactylosporangium matsuzakiense]
MATTAPERRRRTGVVRGVAARARVDAFVAVDRPPVAFVAVALAGAAARERGVARVFEPPRALDVPPPRPAWEVRPAMVTPYRVVTRM